MRFPLEKIEYLFRRLKVTLELERVGTIPPTLRGVIYLRPAKITDAETEWC